MLPRKSHKDADIIEPSDPISQEDLASPSAMSDEEISSLTMIGSHSFLQDSIDRELDKATLEQTPERANAQTVEGPAASKGKKGAYMH